MEVSPTLYCLDETNDGLMLVMPTERAANSSDSAKSASIQEALEHIKIVKVERS